VPHFGLDVVGGWLFGSAAALIAFLAITRPHQASRNPRGEAGEMRAGPDERRRPALPAS